jgi:outer membrane protein TolC
MSHHIENPESEPKCPAILFRIGIAMCCVLAVLAFAGGCSFAPKYNVPKVATPEAFKETNNWKMAEPKDATLRGNWWEMFGDAELNKYESQVCISNQNIAAGFANFMAARAVVREARSQYFPTVSANPSVVHSHQPTSVSSGIATGGTTTGGGTGGTVVTTGSTRNSDTTIYSLPFDATWEPDLWGAVRNTVKADAYNAQASAATLENLRLTAQADLAVDYYELRGQDELKQTYDSTVTAYEKSVKLTKTLFETGIDSEEDVASAETQLATVQAQASNVGIARAHYEHAIALLLGQPASTFSAQGESTGDSRGPAVATPRTPSRHRRG